MKSKNRSNAPEQSSRRRFTKAVAAALVSTPLASVVSADAQTPTTPKQSPAPPTAPSPPAANSQQKPSPVAEAYAEVARARFGERVTPEEFAKIKSDIENSVRAAERLRAFKLQNADEPDFIFGA